MPGGAPIGNQNASKGGISLDPAEYMRNYRKRVMVGRPRKPVSKGDIFEVAAHLERALKEVRLYYFPTEEGRAAQRARVDKALQAYQDYWEKD